MTPLRSFRPGDEGPCGAIVGETPLFGRYGLTAARAAEALAAAAAVGDPIFVADEGDGPLGFAWMQERGAFGRAPYLRLVATTPGRRGGGLGAALLGAFEAHAGSLAPHAYLLVSDFNEAGRRFYARAGWVEVGALPELVLPGVAELLLRKRLR